MLDHSQKYVYTYPIWGGHDVSWTKNLFSGGSWSALEPYDNFWCTYHHDIEAGMAHVGDVRVIPGSKWFAYGSGDRANYYGACMSDEDGPYIEVDSGSDITQIGFRRLSPLGSHGWEEYWYPVKGLKGDIVKMTKDAALSLIRNRENLGVVLNTTSMVEQGKLIIRVDGKTILEEAISTLPLKPYLKEIGEIQGILSLSLQDREGKELLSYTDNPIDESKLPPEGPTVKDGKQVITNEEYVTMHNEDWWPTRGRKIEEMTAEELYLAGMRELRETRERFKEAEEYFNLALQKDPEYSPARTELGILNINKGLREEAEKEFALSIRRNPEQGPAFYYRALVRKMLGKTSLAIKDLFEAAKYHETYTPAYHLLGQIALASGNLDDAILYFSNAARTSHSSQARLLLAATYRKLKQYELAQAALRDILSDEPINYFAAYELYLVAREKRQDDKEAYDQFREIVRDEEQSYLELACLYINSRLYQEAIDLLEKVLELRKGMQCSPLFYYYLGYLYEKIGQDAESSEYFQMAQRIENWDLVFPNRLEEIFILEKAITRDPGDYLAHYALANLLAGRRRFSQALELWQTAAKKIDALPQEKKQALASVITVLYRNMGLILWKFEKQLDEAIPYYEKSIQFVGRHFQPYRELSSIYKEKEKTDKAIEVAESGLNKVRHAYHLVGRFDL